jgi:hypothetical protein
LFLTTGTRVIQRGAKTGAQPFDTDPPYRRGTRDPDHSDDAGGTALRTTTRDLSGATDWNYALGAPNREVTTVQPGGGGSSWTITRGYIYGNPTVAAAWCLGLPTRVDETRTTPSPVASAVRTVTFEYFDQCKLYARNVGPPGTVKTLRTWFTYNAYGNLTERSAMDAVQPVRYYYADQYRVSRGQVIVSGTTTTSGPRAAA